MASPRFYQYASTYFFYFAIVGLAVPFLSVFLDGRGFDSREIGEILAIFTATKIIGPTLWAMAADRTGQQLTIIRLGAGLALGAFTLMFWSQGYWAIVAILALFSLFWTAIAPQLEVATLNAIRANTKIYARIRLWGSVGFIVLAIVAGKIIGNLGSESFVWLVWSALALLFVSTLGLKSGTRNIKQVVRADSIFSRLKQWPFIIFFVAGLLLQISFGPFYSFFSLYLLDLGYSSLAVGLYISLGVLAEIAIFIIAGALFKRFSVTKLIVFSLFVTALRWYLTGHFANNWWLLVGIQSMHAASFGLYHTASIKFIQQHFRRNQQNRGQAIYIAGVYGIGGAIGAYLSGLLWQDGVGAVMTFECAALLALTAAIIAMFIRTVR